MAEITSDIVNKNKKPLIAYEGNFSDNSLNRILKLSEAQLNHVEKNLRIRKKVFKIVVEMIQNIYHHYAKFASKGNESMYQLVKFTLDKQNNVYTICTGNHISSNNASILKRKIDQLNAMSPADLKSAYIHQLINGKIATYGGAGLGMMNILKNSENRLTYRFEKISEGDTFFSLCASVSV